MPSQSWTIMFGAWSDVIYYCSRGSKGPGLIFGRWGGTERRELGQGSKSKAIWEGSDPSDSY